MKYIILLCIFLDLSEEMHSQVRSVQFREIEKKIIGGFSGDSEVTLNIPNVYINGKTKIEKNINEFIQKEYADNEYGWRYEIEEFKGENITPYICKLYVGYEYTFNTSPGLWSFSKLHYFDLRNGECLRLSYIIDKVKQSYFEKFANEQKNNFIQEFENKLDVNREDFKEVKEIIDYTIKDSLSFAEIQNKYDIELDFENKKIILSYDWDYGWGLGRHSLPNIKIYLPFENLSYYLNKIGKELLFLSPITPQNKLFKGYVEGKYPISALLRGCNDSTKITYWYNNSKVPINWTGRIDKSKYLLKEVDLESFEERAGVELQFFQVKEKVQGIGTWKDLKKGRIFTIELFEE